MARSSCLFSMTILDPPSQITRVCGRQTRTNPLWCRHTLCALDRRLRVVAEPVSTSKRAYAPNADEKSGMRWFSSWLINSSLLRIYRTAKFQGVPRTAKKMISAWLYYLRSTGPFVCEPSALPEMDQPKKFCLKYVTPTGTWYTPEYEDEEMLKLWVKALHMKFVMPHYVVESLEISKTSDSNLNWSLNSVLKNFCIFFWIKCFVF